MRLKLIACEVFLREVSSIVPLSPCRVETEWLPQGLHDQGGAAMRARLQQAIDAADTEPHDAIVLAYGLCNNGLAGLTARTKPLVLVRAHDCITAFLGSKERYLAYFTAHPGTYFRTTGWTEKTAQSSGALGLPSQVGGLRLDQDALVAKYGEDNARYLMQELGDLTRCYRRLAFIRMGVEPDRSFEQAAEAEAERRGWEYELVPGDIGLLRRLVAGSWDERDFLVVPPGRRVRATQDERVIAVDEDAP